MIAVQFQVVHAHAAAEFSIEKKLRAKLLISWGWLWHENVLIGDFRVSNVLPCLPLLQHGQDRDGKRISGGQRCHQATRGGDYVSRKMVAMVKNSNFWP